MSTKCDEKQRHSNSDKKIVNKSKSSSGPSRQTDGRVENEDQKENRPKKSSSAKSPAKADNNRHKSLAKISADFNQAIEKSLPPNAGENAKVAAARLRMQIPMSEDGSAGGL